MFGGVSRTFTTGLKASSSTALSFLSASLAGWSSQTRAPLEASSDKRLVVVDLPEDVLLSFFGYETFFKGVFVLNPIAEFAIIIPGVEDCEGTSTGSPVVSGSPVLSLSASA